MQRPRKRSGSRFERRIVSSSNFSLAWRQSYSSAISSCATCGRNCGWDCRPQSRSRPSRLEASESKRKWTRRPRPRPWRRLRRSLKKRRRLLLTGAPRCGHWSMICRTLNARREEQTWLQPSEMVVFAANAQRMDPVPETVFDDLFAPSGRAGRARRRSAANGDGSGPAEAGAHKSR